MSYTRKEVVNWVESQSKYKFQQLKNGVFFCRVLSLRFPQDLRLLKFNPSPISEYDFTCNLNAMKKVLNRHGLQLNLNVHQVLNSKNNYQLAKWFRGLLDRDVIVETSDNGSIASLSRTSSFFNQSENKNGPQTPRHRQNEAVLFRKGLESAEKSRQPHSNLKRLSMAKSEQLFFKEKKPLADLNIPNMRGKCVKSVRIKQTMEGPSEDVGTLLYERALQQTLQGLEKILNRVETMVVDQQEKMFDTFRYNISSAIFKK